MLESPKLTARQQQILELIQSAISRQREFLADASGALMTRYPAGLANALAKIQADGQPIRRDQRRQSELPRGRTGRPGLPTAAESSGSYLCKSGYRGAPRSHLKDLLLHLDRRDAIPLERRLVRV